MEEHQEMNARRLMRNYGGTGRVFVNVADTVLGGCSVLSSAVWKDNKRGFTWLCDKYSVHWDCLGDLHHSSRVPYKSRSDLK